MTSMSVHPPLSVKAEDSRRTAPARAAMPPWAWMAVTCLILAISGGVRYWRDWQFAELTARSQSSPFPLSELPSTLGTWRAREGVTPQLDPKIAQIAGASDHVMRLYDDEKTGEQASALVLYGLGAIVAFHTPDVCYPATGHRLIKGPVDRTINVPGVPAPVRYRWAIYSRQEGAVSRYVESYYTFLHDGEWLPEAADRWKTFRYHPGLFKIQISREVSSLGEGGEGPCESLLAEFARQIHDRSARPAPGPGGATAETASTAGR